ncbi:MAG: inositol monophosphatase [Bacteroidia bacterium]|jgi:myo-inositol-1(or 4)-monophosphatase|nr:inositol monophosphatase [Bacteroidia bacterium]
MKSKEELNTLVAEVAALAKSVGGYIRGERENFSYTQAEIKGLNDLVSYVDKEVEHRIVEGLRPLLEGCGFLVEENTASEKGEYNWIVDPLDGTTNFVHGIPCYAVSIGLEHEGKIILGVVYEVNRDECFYAIASGGAFLNGKPIHVSERNSLSQSLIATGFPIYNFTQLDNYLSALKEFMQKTQGIRRIGSAASDLCYLACGRVDAFFEYNLNPWDVAAGGLIVQEAGGIVQDFKNGNNWLFGKQICAANPSLYEEFSGVVCRLLG